MEYIKKDYGNYLSTQKRYTQIFKQKPFITTNLTVMMELIYSGQVSPTDIKLLEFIYDSSFCTHDQVCRYADTLGISNVEDRLDFLISKVIINSFILCSDKHHGKFPSDAAVFYTLHYGGYQILESESSQNCLIWEQGYQIRGFKMIIKHCLITEITLIVKSMSGIRTEVTADPKFKIYDNGEHKLLSALATYRFEYPDNTDEYLLVDTMIDTDKRFNRNEYINLYSCFLSSNYWKRFYGNMSEPPTLMIITTDATTALDISRVMVVSARKYESFMFLTIDELSHASAEPPFFKCLQYDRENDCMVDFCHYLFS